MTHSRMSFASWLSRSRDHQSTKGEHFVRVCGVTDDGNIQPSNRFGNPKVSDSQGRQRPEILPKSRFGHAIDCTLALLLTKTSSLTQPSMPPPATVCGAFARFWACPAAVTSTLPSRTIPSSPTVCSGNGSRSFSSATAVAMATVQRKHGAAGECSRCGMLTPSLSSAGPAGPFFPCIPRPARLAGRPASAHRIRIPSAPAHASRCSPLQGMPPSRMPADTSAKGPARYSTSPK